MATVYKRNPNTYASLTQLVASKGGTSATTTGSSANRIVINFPAMPETLEIARSAQYENVVQNPIAPNGFHLYRWTEPLRIPLKFSLSARDELYCGDDGPYALLQIAANLHALTVPVITGTSSLLPSAASVTPGSPGQLSESAAQAVAAGTSVPSNTAGFYYPPACQLSIILATRGSQTMGVVTDGFVERVITTFHGPWLQGDFSDTASLRNLPSMVDCEFTFVSQPGYSNNFTQYTTGSAVVTTTALSIYNKFYNDAQNDQLSSYADLSGNTMVGGSTGS